MLENCESSGNIKECLCLHSKQNKLPGDAFFRHLSYQFSGRFFWALDAFLPNKIVQKTLLKDFLKEKRPEKRVQFI